MVVVPAVTVQVYVWVADVPVVAVAADVTLTCTVTVFAVVQVTGAIWVVPRGCSWKDFGAVRVQPPVAFGITEPVALSDGSSDICPAPAVSAELCPVRPTVPEEAPVNWEVPERPRELIRGKLVAVAVGICVALVVSVTVTVVVVETVAGALSVALTGRVPMPCPKLLRSQL